MAKTVKLQKEGVSLSDSWEVHMNLAFGQNWYKKYGQGEYTKFALSDDYPDKQKIEEGLEELKAMGLKKFLPGDTFAKDMCMTVMAPISLAISGAINTATGLLGIGLNLLPALAGSKSSKLERAFIITAMGIGAILLAAVAPMARLYNSATRVLAKGAGAELDPVAELVEQDPEEYAAYPEQVMSAGSYEQRFEVYSNLTEGVAPMRPNPDIEFAYEKFREVLEEKKRDLFNENGGPLVQEQGSELTSKSTVESTTKFKDRFSAEKEEGSPDSGPGSSRGRSSSL